MKTNQSMRYGALRTALFLISIVVLLSNCGEDDTISTALTVTVRDSNGIPQNELNVALYATETDWLNAQNQIRAAETNVQGKVSFSDLEPQEYFIDINENNTTNWGSEVSTILLENKVNDIEITINNSREHLLVGKREKSWILTGATLQGFNLFSDLDDCEKDNIFFYQREDALGIIHLGDFKCEGTAGDQEVFGWEFTNDENELKITSKDGVIQIFKIVSIGNKKMEVDIEIEIEGQLADVRFTFSVFEQ